MRNREAVKKAIFNMGGIKMASNALQVSVSAVGKWTRNGIIPNLDQARKVAEASGFDVTSLRPRFETVNLLDYDLAVEQKNAK
jgi:hypothetical protein